MLTTLSTTLFSKVGLKLAAAGLVATLAAGGAAMTSGDLELGWTSPEPTGNGDIHLDVGVVGNTDEQLESSVDVDGSGELAVTGQATVVTDTDQKAEDAAVAAGGGISAGAATGIDADGAAAGIDVTGDLGLGIGFGG